MKRTLSIAAVLILGCGVAPFLGTDPEVSPLPVLDPPAEAPTNAEPSTVVRELAAPLADVSAGLFAAPVGTVLGFDCSAQLTTWVTNRGTRSASVNCRLAGRCSWTVLARQQQQILAGFALQDLTLTGVEAANARRLTAELGKPAVLRMLDDGTILGIRFAPDMDPGAHNWLRSLVSGARFVARADDAGWAEDELHNDGPRRMQYSWRQQPTDSAPGSLVKESVAEVATNAEGRPKGSVRGQATFDQAIGWLTAMHCEETLVVDLAEAKMQLENLFTCTYTWRERQVVAPPPADWSGPFADMDGRACAEAALTRQRVARLEARLVGVSAVGLLQRLSTIGTEQDGAASMSDTIDLLVAWLQKNPQALTELQTALATGAFAGNAELAAAIALGRCGLPAADAFLLGCLELHHGPSLQLAVVRSVFAQSRVSRALALGVGRLAAESQDPTVANVSLLACGSAVEGVDAAARAEALQCLLALAAPAQDRGELYSWFEAVGNAGAPETVGWIEVYRRNADPAIAADCLLGLRRIPGEAALTMLAAATQDPAARTRRRAAEILGERSEPAATSALVALVGVETDGAVLRTAIDGLARRLPAAAVERVLQRLAAAHPAEQVRALAREALAADRGGRG